MSKNNFTGRELLLLENALMNYVASAKDKRIIIKIADWKKTEKKLVAMLKEKGIESK